jgi:hypothetical protein
MSALDVTAGRDGAGLPAMVSRAASTLASAQSAAEVLEARDMASVAYDMAKRAARLAKAKGAHDELLSKVHRAQADALEIEAAAKRKLADEYDAAQERGEVARTGEQDRVRDSVPYGNAIPSTSKELGISRKDIHEARMIRDAEEAQPGIVRDTIKESIEAGEEPTRAKVRRAVLRTVKPDADFERPRPARGREAIAGRVREAIVALSGLPPPEEVVGFLRGTDAAIIVAEHIGPAADWMAEFSALWREYAEAAE